MKFKQQFIYQLLFTIALGLLVVITYSIFPMEQLNPVKTVENPFTNMPGWLIGLITGGIYLVLYSLIGLPGLFFASRLGLPGIIRPGAGWKDSFFHPLWIGLVCGLFLILTDRFFPLDSASRAIDFHPAFPLSILASLTAGIGEEIIFRGFVMGLWAFLLNLVLKRWRLTHLALWIGNILAALIFAAGHFGSVVVLMGVQSPEQLPVSLVVYIIVLNGFLGLVAGERMMKNGLVAAMGIHFWADFVWHVIWPFIAN